MRISVIALSMALVASTACTNKKVTNPLAKVDSKQPDKVLFDRGMDAMKHNHFDIARLDMQTLINTYPDSEFIARAKLALADSWYAEGGTAALAQAEQEYKDFESFFPNMPEAAEAQLKIANIHFEQMEKPDRDFTHAVRAEQEYRQVILQYPDNQKIVSDAKKKLLQVQEVIAEREFRVGRFYYLRQSYPAAVARLQSLINRYPLYSKADETLYLLGQCYEGEIQLVRRAGAVERQQVEKIHKLDDPNFKKREADRERMIANFTAQATDAYSKILTRYPVMDRAEDAQARLLALHQSVPRPTKAALALNKAEEASRGEQRVVSRVMGPFEKHPDTGPAAKVGDPTLTDPTPVNARDLVQQANRVASGAKGSDALSVTVQKGPPAENAPVPRSDAPASAGNAADTTPAETTAATQDAQPGAAAPDELKPTAPEQNAPGTPTAEAQDSNELKPNVSTDDKPLPAPAQVNELEAASGNGQPGAHAEAAAASDQEQAGDQEIASSRHKKKKGLHKIIPVH